MPSEGSPKAKKELHQRKLEEDYIKLLIKSFITETKRARLEGVLAPG